MTKLGKKRHCCWGKAGQKADRSTDGLLQSSLRIIGWSEAAPKQASRGKEPRRVVAESTAAAENSVWRLHGTTIHGCSHTRTHSYKCMWWVFFLTRFSCSCENKPPHGNSSVDRGSGYTYSVIPSYLWWAWSLAYGPSVIQPWALQRSMEGFICTGLCRASEKPIHLHNMLNTSTHSHCDSATEKPCSCEWIWLIRRCKHI